MRFNDEDTFYACPTGQSGGYNIYQMPIKNEPNCEQIWMLADSCHSGCPVFPAVLPPRPSSPPSAPAACPAELTGDWQVSAFESGARIVPELISCSSLT